MEKERVRRQEIDDDNKIRAQLDQMREAFRKEENPNDPRNSEERSTSQFERESQGTGGRKSQENSLERVGPQSSH